MKKLIGVTVLAWAVLSAVQADEIKKPFQCQDHDGQVYCWGGSDWFNKLKRLNCVGSEAKCFRTYEEVLRDIEKRKKESK